MLSKKLLVVSVLSLFGTIAGAAQAAGTWTLGASVIAKPDPYGQGQKRVLGVPVVAYNNGNFHFNTLSMGYDLINNQSHKLTAMAYWSDLNFKPDDSDDSKLQKLDERKSTVMAGLGYTYKMGIGDLRTSLAADVANRSDGVVADLAYVHNFQGQNWSIAPAFGVKWNSKDQNNYYYGIDAGEAARSGLKQYHADSSWSPYVEVSGKYQMTQNWSAFFAGRVMSLDSTIKDSPMVTKSTVSSAWAGVNYTF